jgi:AraC-like DNA-binding protein
VSDWLFFCDICFAFATFVTFYGGMQPSYYYPPVDSFTASTGCYLISIGSMEVSSGQQYPPAGHPDSFNFNWSKGRTLPGFGFFMITKGEGEWECEHTKGRLVAGDVLYVPPGAWHRYRPDPEFGWHEQGLCLQGAALYKYIHGTTLPTKIQVKEGGLCSSLDERFGRLLGDVAAEAGRNRPSWGIRGLSILLESFELVSSAEGSSSEPAGGTLETACRYIHENSHRNIRVDDVAQHCGRTRRTLERHFEQAKLSTVAEQIAAERVARAEVLLRESNLAIKEIAYDTGFGSVQRMISCFHRAHGCSPGGYRSRVEV